MAPWLRYTLRSAAFAVLLITGGLLVEGCGQEGEPESSPSRPILLKTLFWTSPTEVATRQFLADAIERFNAQEPAAQILAGYSPDEEYKTVLGMQMAANNPPDVFMTWASGFLRPFVQAGKVFELTDALRADPKWRQSFAPGTLEQLSFDGRTYAVPLSRAVVGIFYHKDILERCSLQPPATLAELELAIPALREHGVVPVALGNAFPWVSGMFTALVNQRVGGTEPYDAVAEGRGSWLHPSFLEAAQRVQRLAALGAFPENCNQLSYEDALALFVEKKAAMLVMGSWVLSRLAVCDRELGSNLGFLPFPEAVGGLGSRRDWLGQDDGSLAIGMNCPDKEAALRLLKFMTSEACQARMVRRTELLPAITLEQTGQSCSCLFHDVADAAQDMQSMFGFYDVRLGTVVGDAFNAATADIIAGEPPRQVLERLQRLTEQERSQ